MNQRMIARLVSLEAKLDSVLFAEEMPEKKRRGMGGVLAGTAAVGAGGMALRKRYGERAVAPNAQEALAPDRFRRKIREAPLAQQPREIAGAVMKDAKAMGSRVKGYGGKVAGEVKRYAKGGLNTGAAKDIFRAVRRVKFSRPDQHLQELGARLDEVLEFAEEKRDVMKRLILGAPLTSAMAAPKGQKLTAAKEQIKYNLREQSKGAKQGAVPGALVGAGLGAGALIGRVNKGRPSRAGAMLTKKAGRKVMGKRLAIGAGIGALAGGYAGGIARGIKASYGSNEIHQKARRGELK